MTSYPRENQRLPFVPRCSDSLHPTTLLIRGYDPRPDAVQYGEELIPRIRALVAEHDARGSAAAIPTTAVEA